MSDSDEKVNNDPIKLFSLGFKLLFGDSSNGQETPQEEQHDEKEVINTTGESTSRGEPCAPTKKAFQSCK